MKPNSKYFFQIILISLVLLGCLNIPIRAQEDNGDLELRSTYSLQKYITKYRFWIRNDVGFRRTFDNDPFRMFLIRPRAIFELGSYLDLHAATDFRFKNYQFSPNTFELRTWEGISLHWPDVGRVMFDHFYRFEQRIHWIDGVKQDEISLRSRYRLNMRIPINNRSLIDKTYYVDFRGEVYLPHDDGIEEFYASRMQFGTVIGYRQNIKWRFMLAGYFETGWDEEDDVRSVDRYIIEFSFRTSF